MKWTETDHVELESETRLSTVLREVSRYDLVLGVIPVSLLTSAVGASVTGLALEPVLAAGAIVSLLAMLDGLFLNPPGASETAGTGSAGGAGGDERHSERSPRGGTGR